MQLFIFKLLCKKKQHSLLKVQDWVIFAQDWVIFACVFYRPIFQPPHKYLWN